MKKISKIIGILKVNSSNQSTLFSRFGGHLECQECGSIKQLSEDRISEYMSIGWPKCCDYTMRWITKTVSQIANQTRK